MALTKVSTPAIKDEAITLAKLLHGDANSDGKFLRANNGADPSFETITGTTINNNADNRVITGSGAANTLNAESDVVIDSSGRLLLGTTSILHTLDNKLNVAGTDASTAISLNRYSDNAFAPYLYFRKSRSGTIGGNTSVQDGDLLGRIYFEGNDGSSPVSAAYIEAHVDGTPGNQDMPGRLEFLTAADGSPTPVERMRIDSSGKIGIGTGTIRLAEQLHVLGNGIVTSSAENTNMGLFGTFGGSDLLVGTFNANNVVVRRGNTNVARFTQNGFIPNGTDTAAANALDDYEEGTWTPADYSSSSISITNSNTARYTKIGRFVYLTFDITYASNSSTQLSRVQSPFSAQNYGSGYVGWTTLGRPIQMHVSGTSVYFMDNNASNDYKHLYNNELSGIRLIGAFLLHV